MQFMGKDNVPFHTVIFPATLLGTAQKWTLMHSISVTEYLNYEGTQFSKSRGTGWGPCAHLSHRTTSQALLTNPYFQKPRTWLSP